MVGSRDRGADEGGVVREVPVRIVYTAAGGLEVHQGG
jgi:hypothetical protein